MDPSKSWHDGLYTDDFAFIGGINQQVLERQLGNQTDYADGVTFKNKGVSTDGLGYGRMGFATNSLLSGNGRGIGLFQYFDNPSKFFTAFGTQTPGADVSPTEDKTISRWALTSTAAVSDLISVTGAAFTGLISHTPFNGYDVIADGGIFRRLNGTSNFQGVVIYQPATPTLGATSGTGLSGYYAWCITLVDSSGNESQPSALVASGNLSNVGQTVSFGDTTAFATAGYTTIRLYRTLTSTAAVTASDNPTFYHVVGGDTTITSSVQTYVDAISDTVLEGVNNYQLENVAYELGVLQSLGTGFIPKFVSSFQGRMIAANWTNSGTNHTRRVHWSPISDNSGSSVANFTSWNSLDFNDVGSVSSGDIIGVFAGLAGSFYIFCQNATFVMQATGNEDIPFSFIQISNDRGLYHHSIADAGNIIYGRAKDGIFKFNGSVYTQISYPIQPILGRCLYPEGDSGVYDSVNKRYLLAVLDSGQIGMFSLTAQGTGTHTAEFKKNIITSVRTSVIIFNEDSSSWEMKTRSPIQVFKKLVDSSGIEAIFAVGQNSDILFVTNGDISGSSYSSIGSYAATLFGIGSHTPGTLLNKKLYVPYVMDNLNENFYFSDFQDTIITDSGTNLTTKNALVNFVGTAAVSCMMIVDNCGGTVTSTASAILTDSNNAFMDNAIKFYGATTFNPTTLAVSTTSEATRSTYVQVGADTTKLSYVGIVGSVPSGDVYQTLPYRLFVAGYSNIAYCDYLLPPSGLAKHTNFKKQFMFLLLEIHGEGKLKIDTFVNGAWNVNSQNPTPTESQIITLTAADGIVTKQINFASTRGFFTRIRLRGIRGYTKYKLQSARVRYRLLEYGAST